MSPPIFASSVLTLLLATGCGSAGSPANPAALDAGLPEASAPSLSEAGSPDAADAALPELVWTDCDSKDWFSAYPKPPAFVRCTTLLVPLDHSTPEGDSMTLRLARISAEQNPSQRAVFYLTGGPGASGVEESGLIYSFYARVIKTHDLVFVDRRGTGGSGYLGCQTPSPQTALDWQRCAELHHEKPLDRFMTIDCAHDLEAVRQRLGYDKIVLYGGSYGTRLALEYLRQHEAHAALAVLDGMSTPDWDYFGDMLQILDRGLPRLVDDCVADPACSAVSPTLAADLAARRQALRLKPRPVLLGGTPFKEFEFIYLMALEQALLRVDLRAQVPRAVHQAISGNHALWNKILSKLMGATVSEIPAHLPLGAQVAARPLPLGRVLPRGPFDRRLSPLPLRSAFPPLLPPLGDAPLAPGLRIAVDCAEWLPNAGGTDALAAIIAGQTWMDQDYFERVDKATACAVWPVTPLSAASRQPVTSTVRTLVLSGALDMQTPLAVAERALKTLPAGTHVVLPHTDHGGLLTPCGNQVAQDFILAAGDMTQVDTSCLATISPPAW